MTQGRWPVLTAFVGYQPAWIGPDLTAGLTLAAIAVPEQMATARLAGLPPQVGFVAFLAGSLGFALLGANRSLSAGADSTIAPIFAGVLATLAAAGSPHYLALAGGLALLVGALVFIAGTVRMGWVGNLLSIPVMTGFLAGIAVHILASQLPSALGVAVPEGPMVTRLAALALAAPRANLICVTLAVGVLALIGLCEHVSRRAPGALVAVVLATLAARLLHLERLGVTRLGRVQGGLPHFAAPSLSLDDWGHLAPLALLVCLVVMVQTAAVSHAFAGESGEADVDGDFRGLGLGNVLAGAFGAFPVDASPPRTAIVAEAGGRSQLSSLTAAAGIAVLLGVGMGLLADIPTAALAGILLFVAFRLVRVKDMVAIFRNSRSELALTAATAAGIIVLPIEWGVATGVGLSILHGVWSGARVHVQPMKRIPGSTVWWPAAAGEAAAGQRTAGETVPGVMVLAFPAPLTFLDAAAFARDFLAQAQPGSSDVRLVIFEAAGVVMVDFTAARALERVIKACQAAGVTFAVARLESVAAQGAFARLGLTDLIGADHIFASVAEALDALKPGQTSANTV
jgi:MFS superfamily sulfate permease-like transporter